MINLFFFLLLSSQKITFFNNDPFHERNVRMYLGKHAPDDITEPWVCVCVFPFFLLSTAALSRSALVVVVRLPPGSHRDTEKTLSAHFYCSRAFL